MVGRVTHKNCREEFLTKKTLHYIEKKKSKFNTQENEKEKSEV